MKVLFVGLGSIAKRHIRNLRGVCAEQGIDVTTDGLDIRMPSGLPAGIRRVSCDPDGLDKDYDVIFITDPTEYHLDSLEQFHPYGKHFFIEKPLVSPHQLEKAKRFQRRNDAVYYVGAPLRYNAVIQYIWKQIDPKDILSVRSISSSYLPDWRPGTDYRRTYSAHRDLGGGVAVDLIHEWDYMTYLFGVPEKVHVFSGKKSDLEIDSDDYAIYIAEYGDKIAEIHLDYFGRSTIREIQLFLKEDTVVGDLARNTIRFLRSGEEIDFHEERDDYQKRELRHFLNMIHGLEPAENDFDQAIRVLNVAQGRIE